MSADDLAGRLAHELNKQSVRAHIGDDTAGPMQVAAIELVRMAAELRRQAAVIAAVQAVTEQGGRSSDEFDRGFDHAMNLVLAAVTGAES